MSLGGVEEPVEDGDIGRKQMRRRLHAALGVGQKRTFQMNPDGLRVAVDGRFRNAVWRVRRAHCRVASSGAVTVVARKLPVPREARKRAIASSAAGVASITSWPAAP